jgi:hypothetical protein
MATLTSYGSTFDTPQRAAAVLRALASRFGADLAHASPVDLVAAAIAADAWVLALDADTLGDPSVLDVDTREALANVLVRAAGSRCGDEGPPAHWSPSMDPHHLAAVDRYRDWAVEVLGDHEAPDALRRAASDLTVPGRLGEVAALLALA